MHQCRHTGLGMGSLKGAIIGYGYWGQTVARAIASSEHFSVTHVCDIDPEKLKRAKTLFPNATFSSSFLDVPKNIDFVGVYTPTLSHFEIAKHFLLAGKHALIAKPFTGNNRQAEELHEIAKRNGCTAFADYTFVFHPAVAAMKELLPRIGKPFHVISQRMNLGLYQPDVNVVADLLPHDLSILCHLFDPKSVEITGTARRAAGHDQEDVAHLSMAIDGFSADISLSWLSPFKIRQFLVIGSQAMLYYDDTDVTQRVRLFDRGVDISHTSRISYRSGDMYSPAVPSTDALSIELWEFYESIHNPAKRNYYTQLNFKVCEYLDAAQACVKR